MTFHQEHNKQDDVYSRLMLISQESLECGHYEVAYHALAAALHYAEAFDDCDRLTKVETMAKAHQNWIDAHALNHPMSTESVVKRHGKSMYDMLARQAAMRVLIVNQQQRREQTKRLL